MMKTKYRRNNKGNITIIVAISLTVLIGILAIVIDSGYLYASKNKWQNGVEAAAMAGVLGICDDDFEVVARQIAQENGLPSTKSEGLIVQIGYYDEDDQYGDFSKYKDFEPDPDPDTSLNDTVSTEEDPVYNNAVMVSLNTDVSTFFAGIFGRDKVNVTAKAVAYLERFLMISIGEGETPGITTATGSYSWPAGHYPSFHNGIVYSNNDILFDMRGDCDGPEFVNSHAYAHGRIYALDENGQTPTDEFGESGVKEIEVPPINWDELRAQAEANGKVINMAFYQGLSIPCADWGDRLRGYWGTDEFNNCYFFGSSGSTYFAPYPGDHDGRTYFFENGLELIYLRCSVCPMSDGCCDEWPGGYPIYDRSVTGMTMAAVNGSICLHGAPTITWGGDNAEDIVNFYSAGDIILGKVPAYTSSAGDYGNEFAGAFLRAETNFGFNQSGHGDNPAFPIRKMRVIAGDRIFLNTVPNSLFGLNPPQTEYGFDANFGPPCPPFRALLGKLEPAGG